MQTWFLFIKKYEKNTKKCILNEKNMNKVRKELSE